VQASCASRIDQQPCRTAIGLKPPHAITKGLTFKYHYKLPSRPYSGILQLKGRLVLLDFKEFIASVQAAVNEAAGQIQAKNLELLDSYFVPADEPSGDEAESDRARPTPYPPSSLAKALCNHKRPPSGPTGRGDEPEEPRGALRPKMAVLQYPVVGPNGPETQDVWVPLLAIVPQNQLALDELKLTLKVEVSENGSNLRIAMPKRHSWFSRSSPSDVGTVEITIKAEPTTAGRMDVIDGYEKALRSQIPG
jgi:hypothetical protein